MKQYLGGYRAERWSLRSNVFRHGSIYDAGSITPNFPVSQYISFWLKLLGADLYHLQSNELW